MLGLEGEVGTLEAGKWADLCCVDLSGPATQPIGDPLAQLVFGGGRDIVSDVWVAGRQLLSGGELTRLDWPDVAASLPSVGRANELREVEPMNPAQNADPAELAKFSALAKAGGIQPGPSKPLARSQSVAPALHRTGCGLGGARVLDVGCGGGILSEAMAQRGADVLGIDLSQAVLDVAELHALEGKVAVEYQAIAAEELAAAQPGALRFGHLHGNARACSGSGGHRLRALARLVKPGGECHRLHAQPQAAGIRGGDPERAHPRYAISSRARSTAPAPLRRSIASLARAS